MDAFIMGVVANKPDKKPTLSATMPNIAAKRPKLFLISRKIIFMYVFFSIFAALTTQSLQWEEDKGLFHSL